MLPPFAHLIDAHGDELLAHARRLAGPDAAEDVVQDALLRALRAYPRLRHGDHLRAWLYRITTNAAMDRFRSGRPEILMADAGADRAATDDESLDGFEALIGELPDRAQATLRLRFVDDLEYEVIATRLDCTPEAARARVSHALRTLRERTVPA